MVFWGDLMHVAAVQFENPSITIQFDTDSKAAAVAAPARPMPRPRRRATWWPPPTCPSRASGGCAPQGSGYVWLPVNYVPAR